MTLLSAFGGALWVILVILFGGGLGALIYGLTKASETNKKIALIVAAILIIAGIGSTFWMLSEK